MLRIRKSANRGIHSEICLDVSLCVRKFKKFFSLKNF